MAGLIHLIFKTHLDIGFTDHAARVRAQYHERFIPQAIDTGEHFFAENPERPLFIWTTGAWLIWDHLQTQPAERVARLERAIVRGLIRWHALPFTTHTELMSPALFRAGLSYAQELDRRFGMQTTAAKMTDVPGHTLGMVPLLAEAGVRFLHLGVNTASPVPDVPDVFRWRAPDGAEVVVMYQNSYGATHLPAGFDEGLSFAHTSDNMGPQSVPQVADVYREIERHHPGVEVRASTLDAYGDVLWERRAELPVIDYEIGDSWIHGSASDPTKTQRFLALQRLYDGFAEETLTPSRLAFGRGLAMVAEHTCGVDIKSYLRDETAWDRPAFEQARQSDYRFAYAEASWDEQRRYLAGAVAELEGDDRVRADQALAELEPELPMAAVPATGVLARDGWTIAYDAASGDVTEIASPSGVRLAGAGGALIAYSYESYDADDVAAHMDSYLTHREPWAVLDHSKPGLEHARTARSAPFTPVLSRRLVDAIELKLPEEAQTELGAPAAVRFNFRPLDQRRIEIAVTLVDKPANRMPEASFLAFTPGGGGGWEYRKMGLLQPGDRVARKGGGQLQAVSAVRRPGLEVVPLDTPLVAPVRHRFMPFDPEPTDLSGGIRFNLHNNKWGTNFPMWWSGTLNARFVLTLG